jgi:hypothetical protein
MNQETLNVILQIIGWTGLIVISPFLGRFSFALVKYLSYKLFPIKAIYVEYKRDGVVVNRIKVKLDSSDALVTQLAELRKGHENECSK